MPHPLALVPLVGLPMPPHLIETLGYPGDAHCVGFYWVGQKFLWDDGRRSATSTDWHAWRIYTEHPRVAKFLKPFSWYDEFGVGAEGLALNSDTRIAYVGPVSAICEYLGRQYPPSGTKDPIVLDEAHWAALTARLVQAHAQFGAERARYGTEQGNRLQALCDWLDGCR